MEPEHPAGGWPIATEQIASHDESQSQPIVTRPNMRLAVGL
jgi:hypothetical protein